MANIKNLAMASNVLAYPNIYVHKTLLGLHTDYIYQPTQSKLTAYTLEYNPTGGERVEKLLKAPETDICSEVEKCGELVNTPIGHWHLEACISGDHRFAALQLFKFSNFTYNPVTDIRVYEGDSAEKISALFVR